MVPSLQQRNLVSFVCHVEFITQRQLLTTPAPMAKSKGWCKLLNTVLLVAAYRVNYDELEVEAYSANKGWRIKGEVFWELNM